MPDPLAPLSPAPAPQHSRADKIFAIGITLALVGALGVAIFMALRFWHGTTAGFDPAASWPLFWGVTLSLVLGGAVVGVFLYGRQREIRGEESSNARAKLDM
jgi:TRAP-type C4-dicarboxylate transport system permease small subunit